MAKKRLNNKIEYQDGIIALLSSWRKLLLAALIGAAIAILVFVISPPNYRARATVVVDQNVEEAWTYFPDRQLFQFMRRETARLVELAWSDAVLEKIAQKSGGQTLSQLRERTLQLSQPADGGWHFYARHIDKEIAASMVNAWAKAFVSAGQEAVEAEPKMQAARQALFELVLSDPEPDNQELVELTNRITEMAEGTRGISPYVELYFSEIASAPIERSVSQASYLLVGSIAGAGFAALVMLFWPTFPKIPKS